MLKRFLQKWYWIITTELIIIWNALSDHQAVTHRLSFSILFQYFELMNIFERLVTTFLSLFKGKVVDVSLLEIFIILLYTLDHEFLLFIVQYVIIDKFADLIFFNLILRRYVH